ncbi:MAG: hypothetical protein HC923_03745 [Myxococcales bacterium]|nr:hypothetical protein [Myxococcales bacterium]
MTRLGRVADRALDALSEVETGHPADVALRRVEGRAKDLGSKERAELRDLVFGLLRNRRAVQDALQRAMAAERRPALEGGQGLIANGQCNWPLA